MVGEAGREKMEERIWKMEYGMEEGIRLFGEMQSDYRDSPMYRSISTDEGGETISIKISYEFLETN